VRHAIEDLLFRACQFGKAFRRRGWQRLL
jgi:hypothetical protein